MKSHIFRMPLGLPRLLGLAILFSSLVLLLPVSAQAATDDCSSETKPRKRYPHEYVWFEGEAFTDREMQTEEIDVLDIWRKEGLKDQIQAMRLWMHDFDDLPPDIHKLRNLKVLEVSFQGEFRVDKRWKLPPHLEQLKINGVNQMRIGKGSPSFDRLIGLALIGKEDSSLTVPAKWCAMKKLEYLHIGLANEVVFEMPACYPKLTNLSISDCNMQQIPVGFEESPIETLSMAGNKLQQLPAAVQRFQRLRYLELYQNDLTDLPDFVLEFNQLATLGLTANHFRHLPKQIYQMPQLKHLSIGGQDSLVVSDSIRLLKNLTELYINHSRIKEIPESIGELTQLEELVMNGNRIKSLPESIVNCKQLRELGIRGNPIEELPKKLLDLPDLESLSCESQGLMNGDLEILAFVLKDGFQIPKVPDSIDGKPLSEYLARPDIEQGSKLYMQGKIRMQSDAHYRAMLDSMLTENEATRPYYIALIMTILAPSNGDSEVYFGGRKFSRFPLVDSLGKLTRRQPKWFLTHVMHGPYSDLYADWIKTVPILEEEFRQVETFIAYIREQVLSPEEVPAFEKDLFQLRWDLIERYKGRY